MTNIILLSDFSTQENRVASPKDMYAPAEIISLWELLQWPRERTRFIPIENQNPGFTQKIDKYKQRVQHGIWNLTDSSFSPTFDMIFKVCLTVLWHRAHPEFPRDDIIVWIHKLSLFECQYILSRVDNLLPLHSQDSFEPREAYVHMIKNYIERRMREIWNIEEMYFESHRKK